MSDDYDNLQEQKSDRDCDELENGSLTESFIASIEEQIALDTKFVIKKFDKAAFFSCFSPETGQDTMKEVQEAFVVENTSLMSVRTIFSTNIDRDEDYQGKIISNDASETISAKTSINCEQPAYCRQKTTRRKAPAGLRVWEIKRQKLMKSKKTRVLNLEN